jgi:phage terminase large subunit-like protein
VNKNLKITVITFTPEKNILQKCRHYLWEAMESTGNGEHFST